MLKYGAEACSYDVLGNPTTYRGKTATWEKGRLKTYNGVTLGYDGRGKRISSGSLTFEYSSDGKLLKRSDGLEFIYDTQGLAGVVDKSGSTVKTYFYRKDAQGNIIALLDENGAVVVKYVYNAWGEHKVLGADGTENTSASFIGNLNPFRYRGYYYDTSLKLYYLVTRYYDPIVGRFISQDSFEYADPDTINGLNLYAYCNNNPVMNVDPTGEFLLSFLAALGIAAIIGAAVGVVGMFMGDVITSAISGQWQLSSWETYLGNAIGGAVGGVISLFSPTIGGIVGSALGTFAGNAIGKITGTNGASWTEILIDTGIAIAFSAITIGLNKYLKIPGITKGSHSFQQVFKSGFTKALRYHFSMSLKTLAKEVPYLIVSSFTTGFLASNSLQGIYGVLKNFFHYNERRKALPDTGVRIIC